MAAGWTAEGGTLTVEAGAQLGREDFTAIVFSCGYPDRVVFAPGTEEIPDRFMERDALSKVRSVSLPEGLVRIGSRAFAGSAFEEVSVPASVEEAGTSAFSGCRALRRVFFRGADTRIGPCCFKGCVSLYGIDFPDNLREVPEGCFEGCCSLVSLTVPESASSIGKRAFSGCGKLEELSIRSPDCAVADGGVFQGTVVADVAITPGGLTELSLRQAGAEVEEPGEAFPKKGVEYFPSLTGDLAACAFRYDDSWFGTGSYAENGELDCASLKFALSAYGAYPARAFLGRCGFEFSDSSPVDAPLPAGEVSADTCYFPDPSADGDTVGYAWGKKELSDFTLIAMAVQGADYGAQWSSNLELGAAGDHNGFRAAADRILAAVGEAVASCPEGKPVKLWLTGYSRGGAAANLAAGDIDGGAIPGLEPENLYCRTFEAPEALDGGNRDVIRYGNIVNFRCRDDFVTMVFGKCAGLGLYGKTHTLDGDDVEDAFLPQGASPEAVLSSDSQEGLASYFAGFCARVFFGRAGYSSFFEPSVRKVFSAWLGGQEFTPEPADFARAGLLACSALHQPDWVAGIAVGALFLDGEFPDRPTGPLGAAHAPERCVALVEKENSGIRCRVCFVPAENSK